MKDRVLITYPASDLPFLPPFDDFLRLAVAEGGMPSIIRQVASAAGEIPPSEKTLRKSLLKPVTRSTANRIVDIFRTKLPETTGLDRLAEAFRPWEELGLKSNGASWLPAVMGMRNFILKEKFPDPRAEQFIRSRVNAEYEFLVEVRAIVTSGSSTEADRQVFFRALQRLLNEHTVVDQTLIEEFCQLSLTKDSTTPERQRVEEQLWQEIRIDFYYNLLCNLSLDVIEQLKLQGIDTHAQDEMVGLGFVGVLAPVQDTKGHITLPFEHLLNLWRSVLTPESDGLLSWRKLSAAIPHPRDVEIASLNPDTQRHKDLVAAAAETRKTRLKEWREGVSPSSQQLDQFVANLVPENSDGYYAWLRAHLAVVWGKLIQKEVALLNDGGLDGIEKQSLLFRYHDVWQRYKRQAAKIMAA